MTLRAIKGQNPKLSTDTDAQLSAVDTGFLLSGDLVWSDETGLFVYRPNSTDAPSAGFVLVTANSDGGSLPGRFVFTGIGPSGGGGSAIVVQTYAELDAVPSSSLQDGTRLYLDQQHSNWYLRSGAVPANSNADTLRAATSATPKFWERELVGSPSWWLERMADEGAAFVDSDAGSDDAVGSSTDPLLSVGEVMRRIKNIVLEDQTFEVQVAGADFISDEPIAPIGKNFGGLSIIGAFTADGSGVVTSTSFNRATNQAQEYSATVAALPLTSYTSTGGGPYHRIIGDNASGWILRADTAVAGNVYAPTFATFGARTSITNATAVQVSHIASIASQDVVIFDASKCENLSVSFIGFQAAIVTGCDSDSGFVFFDRCGFSDFGVSGGFVDCEACYFDTSINNPGSEFQIARCSFVNRIVMIGGQLLVSGGTFMNFGGGIAIKLVGGNHMLTDVEVDTTGDGYLLQQGANLVLPTFAWGKAPNGGAATIAFHLQQAGTFVTYTTAASMTQAGGTALVRLTMPSGNTDAANSGALPVRNSNGFIGFVDGS